MKALLEYFIEAAKLLYKEPKLWLGYLFFFFLTIPYGPIEQSPFAWVFGAIGIIAIYLGGVYGISSPVFFEQVQSKKQLSLKFMILTLKTNTKRLIWPLISCTLLFFLSLILVALITAIYSGNPEQIATNMANLFGSAEKPFSLIYLIVSLIFIPFLFTDVLFSIEKERFWQAVKKSPSLAFKFPKFTLAMLLVPYFITSLINFLPNDPQPFSLFKQAMGYLIAIWLIGTSFLFYQKNIAKK